jgi:hypothetical protein
MANTLILLAATAGESEGVNPWIIGGLALGGLLLLLLAVVAFGGGREHS